MKLYNDATITIDSEDKGGKGRHFTSRFIEAGICSYARQGGKVILITKETIDKFAQSMVGCPVIIEHSDVTDDNANELRTGVISKVWFNETDGWFWCEGVVWGDDVETLINEKGYSVSCGYYVLDKNKEGGLWHDIEYDEEVLNGSFEHLAIVSSPRYRDATILLNSTEKGKLDMKFFAKKIHNESKEDEMDKKQNESTDKREIIDEVGGILKGKVDEEVWRTVIGKLEKIAYEGSEDDKKDNESDEDEMPKEEKEDKKENKKNASKRNESDEDEEDHKEEKKENKRNSSSFDKLESVRNSTVDIADKSQSLYTPEHVRLARGLKY